MRFLYIINNCYEIQIVAKWKLIAFKLMIQNIICLGVHDPVRSIYLTFEQYG